jgi:hypothetical protein
MDILFVCGFLSTAQSAVVWINGNAKGAFCATFKIKILLGSGCEKNEVNRLE